MTSEPGEWANVQPSLMGYDQQLELATVIHHEPRAQQESSKPAGIRLANMLQKYDNAPSSELWREIQALSWEILK